MDVITDSIAKLTINKYDSTYESKIDKIIKIQKWYRGCIFRLHRLPLIMYIIKKYLLTQTILFCNDNLDGRINSCMDEENIIKLLIKLFILS